MFGLLGIHAPLASWLGADKPSKVAIAAGMHKLVVLAKALAKQSIMGRKSARAHNGYSKNTL